MTKEQKIEAIDFTIKVLKAKRERLVNGTVVPFDEDPCPKGQLRNAEGICVDDIG